ncbi:serine/threonine protein kinase [Labilithrix luteola]|uniref:Serine/threonine protein kinase n=1 Tax=Labilithrix luteola TaxID=1391654 RepID=A0A0K1QGT3_9BACT|nr:serine/threonine-protein kinase [Labilithrix luteola]AKV04645.1 serine/threonine protein kinase [Labilithrix luteola]
MAADALGFVGSTVEQVRFDACVDAGGFGLVYRGRHLGLDEEVAIKCLRIAQGNANGELRDTLAMRFRDETKILYRLSQGSLDIVRCIGGGAVAAPKTGELTPYTVLEWLEGKTLAADLRERRENKVGGRSLEQAVNLLDGAVRGLAHAHAQGVVHRDVKPGNLFMLEGRDGVRVKVLDFGMAKILSDETLGIRGSVQTLAGTYTCSPSYGAPEQFSPKIGAVGPWTDVYSLTLVLLELLLGEKARPARSIADGLLKALEPSTGSPKPSSFGMVMPPAVEELLGLAVSQDPKKRPSDVGVFWASLRDAMRDGPSILARLPPEAAKRERAREADGVETVPEPDEDSPSSEMRPSSLAAYATNFTADAPPPAVRPVASIAMVGKIASVGSLGSPLPKPDPSPPPSGVEPVPPTLKAVVSSKEAPASSSSEPARSGRESTTAEEKRSLTASTITFLLLVVVTAGVLLRFCLARQ